MTKNQNFWSVTSEEETTETSRTNSMVLILRTQFLESIQRENSWILFTFLINLLMKLPIALEINQNLLSSYHSFEWNKKWMIRG